MFSLGDHKSFIFISCSSKRSFIELFFLKTNQCERTFLLIQIAR